MQNYPGTPTDTVNTSTTFAQSTVTMIRTVRTGENLHVVLWLLKDLCWIMDLRVVGLVMVLPTVWLAVRITWRSRNDRSDLFHSAAVVCWILANSTWIDRRILHERWYAPACRGLLRHRAGVDRLVSSDAQAS